MQKVIIKWIEKCIKLNPCNKTKCARYEKRRKEEDASEQQAENGVEAVTWHDELNEAPKEGFRLTPG